MSDFFSNMAIALNLDAKGPPSLLADAKVFNAVYATINTAVDRIAIGASLEERVKFSCPQNEKFVWIMVSRMGHSKLLACTNDKDLSVGQPPSFWHTAPIYEKDSLVTAIVNHLAEVMKTFAKLEVLHECSLT